MQRGARETRKRSVADQHAPACTRDHVHQRVATQRCVERCKDRSDLHAREPRGHQRGTVVAERHDHAPLAHPTIEERIGGRIGKTIDLAEAERRIGQDKTLLVAIRDGGGLDPLPERHESRRCAWHRPTQSAGAVAKSVEPDRLARNRGISSSTTPIAMVIAAA